MLLSFVLVLFFAGTYRDGRRKAHTSLPLLLSFPLGETDEDGREAHPVLAFVSFWGDLTRRKNSRYVIRQWEGQGRKGRTATTTTGLEKHMLIDCFCFFSHLARMLRSCEQYIHDCPWPCAPVRAGSPARVLCTFSMMAGLAVVKVPLLEPISTRGLGMLSMMAGAGLAVVEMVVFCFSAQWPCHGAYSVCQPDTIYSPGQVDR